jgi:DNA-binding FadR family transcriptional regulator
MAISISDARKPGRLTPQSQAGTRRQKLPAKIARRLEDRILAEGWPVGHQIGSEAALAADLGVGRRTLREAVRILEVSGFVESRKGAGGGLFVASEADDFACKMVSNYLEFVRVDVDDFNVVHRTLNLCVIDAAIARISKAQAQEIRALIAGLTQRPLPRQVSDAQEIHRALRRVAANPALTLLMGVLGRMMLDASILSTLNDEQWSRMPGAIIARHLEMTQAIIERRRDAAHEINEKYVQCCAKLFVSSSRFSSKRISEHATERAYRYIPRAKPKRKAERVERQIRDMVVAAGWPVGDSLGFENELAERFGVGRSVLREALRSLEQLGVVEMGRGGRSGLRVISPDSATVVQTCHRHLRREGLTPQQAGVVRKAIETSAQHGSSAGRITKLFLQILG